MLAGGRRGEFLYGDDKANISAILMLLHRVRMKQGELFGNVLLGKFPIAQEILPRRKGNGKRNNLLNTRILGRGGGQVNATEENGK